MATQKPQSVLKEVRTALTEYYALLCAMPHMDWTCLHIPPSAGWSNVDTETLKATGRSEAAIDFLRHLPYLTPCQNNDAAWVTPTTVAIGWGLGETIKSYKFVDIAVPTYVVQLTQSPYSQGCSILLLDTQSGNIVDYRQDGAKISMPWEEYEQLPDIQKWMAYRSVPAKEFFSWESQRLRKLVYMPVPTFGNRKEPRFIYRAKNALEEDELFAVDDEYDADQEVDPDFIPEQTDAGDDLGIEDLHLSSSDDEDVNDEDEISEEELEGLKADAEQEIDVPGQITASLSRWEPKELPQDTLEVYHIYKRNNWPHDNYDRDRCLSELLEWEKQKREKEHALWELRSKESSEKYKARLAMTPEQLEKIKLQNRS